MPKPSHPAESPSDTPSSSSSNGATRGGARAGAGRPKGQGRWGEPTTTVRVPQSQVSAIKNWLDELADLNSVINNPQGLPDSDQLATAGLTRLLPSEINSMLPLVLYSGRIAAGFPSPADDYADERIDLNRHLIRHKEATFFLRVQGDSMLGAGIHDGDLLIVDRAITATDGKVVIAALDGELTVKRLSIRGEVVRLVPENPAYPVIEVNQDQDLVIWGVVTNVIHALS
ncbi:MAG: hypothetical protein B7X12_00740 [Halothiobacillus sp. 20-53-49]|nr:translesion error-prone DNA polymerase V autoproteolytic subunit [Halothiobacillus sp. 15-55-196]OYV47447.1 MAG: hypothetical protein B7X12_00740 [Halothiobacillus sp. 20-53-49]OZB37322.1 MAG: hypothetical protein B7X44_02675 [Halothiobacillus sp. 15-55-196]